MNQSMAGLARPGAGDFRARREQTLSWGPAAPCPADHGWDSFPLYSKSIRTGDDLSRRKRFPQLNSIDVSKGDGQGFSNFLMSWRIDTMERLVWGRPS